jgi:hypothetical protein
MAWKKRSWRKKNDNGLISTLVSDNYVRNFLALLIVIAVFKIYAIIGTWLFFLLIIAIIGWIYLRKNTNKINEESFKESNESSVNNNEENYEKGIIFEKYVANLFDPSYFNIFDWTRDNSKHLNRKIESDQNPDLTIRYIPTNELFSIECKFRSNALDNKVSWARDDQIKNYLSYSIKNKRPVFVLIGLGGSPDNPNRMFCIPIEEAKYSELFISMLRKYERNPSQKLFWKNGNLS